MSWEEFATRWGDIGIGGLLGTSAKYGLIISERRPVTWRWLVGDALLLGFVLLAARMMADWMKLDREGAAMCGALCALGSYKMVQIVRARFLKKVDDTLAEMAAQRRGEIREELQMEASGERTLKHLADGEIRDLPPSAPIYRKPVDS